jgi:hypothetical protein
LLCLKRALRIANAAQQMANVARGSSGPVTLFVEILNKLVTLSYKTVWFDILLSWFFLLTDKYVPGTFTIMRKEIHRLPVLLSRGL